MSTNNATLVIASKKRSTFGKLSFSDKAFHIINYTLTISFTLIVLYPLLWALSASFSSSEAIIRGNVWLWPVNPTVVAYKAAFSRPALITGFFNSVFYTAGSICVTVPLILISAYPMSRRDLPGRYIFIIFFTITMFFGGGMIPNYLLIRSLGMMNTPLAVIVPFSFSCYNMIIARTYFYSNIPDELLEAAKMDGCGDVYFFLSVVVPLSKPLIAVMVLFCAVGNWNSYMNNLLYFTDTKLFGLQMVLRELLFALTMTQEQKDMMDPDRLAAMEDVSRLLKFSVIYIGAAPMLILYPFIQKFFVKGVMIGAIKG
ncbi:MAG: carbohydrate ABC transporter permease [Oscillospiraceae bacterium]|nr:carbohydrate ABC transporter permease [Oscillospiraceae bacterium]